MRDLLTRIFKPREREPFRILRVGIGLACLVDFLPFAPRVIEDFSNDGYYPQSTWGIFGPSPGPPYLLGLSDQPGWVLLCYGALLMIAGLFTVGWRTRWSGPLLWLLQLSFVNRNIYVMAASPILSIQLLLIVMWFDLGMKSEGGQGPPAWAGWLLTLQMSVCYFKSGLYKAMGKAWMQGDAINLMLSNPTWRRLNLDSWLDNRSIVVIVDMLTRLTVAWEVFFPLLILNRRTRLLALGLGVIIHTGQFMTVSTASFPILLLATYPCLLGDDDYDFLKRTFSSKIPRRFRTRS